VILEALWFFLPAGIANMAPVAAAKLPGLRRFNTPMDFGKSWHGQRIFGANKTWRGLAVGIAVATIVIGLQKYLFSRSLFVTEISWFDYRPTSVWLLGPLFGTGALLGDAIKSFFKRQKNVSPGSSWFPFDQIDYIVGSCLLSLFVVRLPLANYTWVLAVGLGGHVIIVYLFYLMGVREKPI
jgi:CDP-2,3-bis-(O-geranylgeranyl)-sn-glycerol synthase